MQAVRNLDRGAGLLGLCPLPSAANRQRRLPAADM
jgi:hypothetical protein